MPDRDIVNMQMRSCFIEMKNGIKDVKVWIAFLEILHVFTQAGDSNFRIDRADSRIIFRANLHQVLIEALLLVRSRDNALARLSVEQVLKVAIDLAVISFLTSVVSFYCVIEKLVIGFAQILTDKNNIVRSP